MNVSKNFNAEGIKDLELISCKRILQGLFRRRDPGFDRSDFSVIEMIRKRIFVILNLIFEK